MERERHHQRPSSNPRVARRVREQAPVRDDYVTHVRSLVPVRGSDPWTFASVVFWGIYEYVAGFWHVVDLTAFVVVGLALAAAWQRRRGAFFEPGAVAAGFVALLVVGFLFAGVREYYRPLPPVEEGHVGLGPLFREILVPHKERGF